MLRILVKIGWFIDNYVVVYYVVICVGEVW